MPSKKTTAKKTRGRPGLSPTEGTKVISIRVTDRQGEKLQRLGGAAWVRERIDRAKEPAVPAAQEQALQRVGQVSQSKDKA